MSVKRSVLAIAALGVLLVVLTATGSSTADSDLEGQMAALKERIATLEAELATIKKNVRGHHPDPAMERAALTAYQEINTLVQAGQMVAAKPKLDAFMAEYANTRPGQRARSLQTELSVVGKPAPQTS